MLPLQRAVTPYSLIILLKLVMEEPEALSVDDTFDMCLVYDMILNLSIGAKAVFAKHMAVLKVNI